MLKCRSCESLINIQFSGKQVLGAGCSLSQPLLDISPLLNNEIKTLWNSSSEECLKIVCVVLQTQKLVCPSLTSYPADRCPGEGMVMTRWGGSMGEG